jgi:hypothetical protein
LKNWGSFLCCVSFASYFLCRTTLKE